MSSLYGVMAKFAAARNSGGFDLSATSSNVFWHSMFAILFEGERVSSGPEFPYTELWLSLQRPEFRGGFNPIATSSNVFGHGMFAILFGEERRSS